MKLAVFNGDGERIGTISDYPFNTETKSKSSVNLDEVFDGVGNATDVETNTPPVNPEQLAAEGFDVENISRRQQLIRNIASEQGYGLVPLSEV